MRNKEQKKWGVIIITIFIALSMVLSIFAIVLDNQSNQQKYNGYKFFITNEGYKFKVNEKLYTFQYHPLQLESINLTDDSKELLSNSMAIGILFDPNSSIDDLTYIDYARFDFQEKSGKQIYFAITRESENYILPVLSCENSTKELPFILFNISSDVSIVRKNSCIIINSKLRDIIATEERISYYMLGIMK